MSGASATSASARTSAICFSATPPLRRLTAILPDLLARKTCRLFADLPAELQAVPCTLEAMPRRCRSLRAATPAPAACGADVTHIPFHRAPALLRKALRGNDSRSEQSVLRRCRRTSATRLAPSASAADSGAPWRIIAVSGATQRDIPDILSPDAADTHPPHLQRARPACFCPRRSAIPPTNVTAFSSATRSAIRSCPTPARFARRRISRASSKLSR